VKRSPSPGGITMSAERKTGDSHVWLPGRAIAPGVAFGYARFEDIILSESVPSAIEPGALRAELERLNAAVDQVRRHLEAHVRELHAPAEEDFQQILAAHLVILDDKQFFLSIRDRIETELMSADRAVREAFLAVAERLTVHGNGCMHDRAEDFRDICQNLRKSLLRGPWALEPREQGDRPIVCLTPHLHPTAVLRAKRTGAVAFVTASRAFTSHGAILLQASGIPALGGVAFAGVGIKEGTPILVDAVRGGIHVNPSSETREAAFAKASPLGQHAAARALPPLDARTPAGRAVRLWANISHPSEIALSLQHRLRGVGLFRTEFLALESGHIPDEDEQYGVYREVVEELEGRPLVIRSFDFGADKEPAGLDECTGNNPALGVRGLRRHLQRRPEELHVQIRAILRAAVGADVSILFPMVTHAGDMVAALAHLAEVRVDLGDSGVQFNPEVKVGAMIEVPSAALGIAELLHLVDFVSIGTNDLLQYLTASDRDNVAVIDYQCPEAAGLFRLVEYVVDTARSVGMEQSISVCGELASDPAGASPSSSVQGRFGLYELI